MAKNGHLKIEYRPIKALLPYPRNARTHSDEQIRQVVASIKEFGWTNPVLIDATGGIVAGHARVEAAKALGLATVPTIRLSGLTDAQRRAYVIADNKLALNAGWDEELLRLELTDLKDLDFDLGLTGFDERELAELLADKTAGLTDPDDAPPAPEAAVTVMGDLWILGRHRLICGDAMMLGEVERLTAGCPADMVFTDPPYGVAYRDTGAGAWNKEKLAKKKAGTLKPRFNAIANDDLDEKQLYDFLACYMAIQPLRSDAAQYVCHASLRAHIFREALLDTGYEIRAEIIWAKSRPGFNFAHYKHQHEPIYYAVPVGGGPQWYGDRTQTTLWNVASESGAVYKHPTQKPVDLARRAIENSSALGGLVFEPFCGRGSTVIAAEMGGRATRAMEIDPHYVDVAVERWQKFTGKEAILEGDGRTFLEIKAERHRDLPALPKEDIHAVQ
jgi:DNA modification methylase